MKKHLNIILANAPINNGNRGCVALTISTLALLDEVMKQKGVEYDVYLPDSGFKNCDLMTYTGIGLTYKYHVCDYYRHVGLKTTLKKKVRSLLSKVGFKKVFRDADFILDLGQGDSFADIYGKYRFDMIDLIHSIARELHKPYLILPQTIGPFKNPNVKKLANESILKASTCLVRDKQSFDYVQQNVPGQKNLKECIDVAFFMPYEHVSFDEKYVHVGLNVSALLWNGGYTKNNQFGLLDDYKQVVRSVIDYFIAQPNIMLHLVPHVVSAERNIENDYEVCYELWREYKNTHVVLAPFALGPMEIKSYISGLDFFMGARMHSTIGAFSSGVPVVPMAYSRKFNGLFADTLQYPYMVDLKNQKLDDVMTVVAEGFSNRLKLKTIIEERVNGIVKERKQVLIDSLDHFFEGK